MNPDGHAKFFFADIVVVNTDEIGCIVKTWHNHRRGYHYEVYIRSLNRITEFDEAEIQRYVVSKELSNDERAFH